MSFQKFFRRSIKEKTQQLDSEKRQSLTELLEDVPAEKGDLEHLQKEIEEAHVRLGKLQDKESYVGTRLEFYNQQLDKLPEPKPEYVETLGEIAKSHKSILRGISILEARIAIMEARQQDLRGKAEECQLVRETAESLKFFEADAEQTEEVPRPQEDAPPVEGGSIKPKTEPPNGAPQAWSPKSWNFTWFQTKKVDAFPYTWGPATARQNTLYLLSQEMHAGGYQSQPEVRVN